MAVPALIVHAASMTRRQQRSMGIVIVFSLLFHSVLATPPRRGSDTSSRPYLLPYHHTTDHTVLDGINLFARQGVRAQQNNKSHTNDIADDVKSCGSCCYEVVAAQSPLNLTFYTKMIDLNGFLIASSSDVRDAALYQAALNVATMTEERPDLLQLLVDEQVILAVIGKDEVTRDIPQYADLDSEWDAFRGISATESRPTTSCAEENLLCLTEDVYHGENICIHETAHSLAGSGGKLPNPRFMDGANLDQVLQKVYNVSVNMEGLWARTYAGTNYEELWAEGVQSYFNVNYLGTVGGDGIHNNINTRLKLKDYDPYLYAVTKNIFGKRSTAALTCPTTTTCNCTKFVCPSTARGSLTPTLSPAPSTSVSPSVPISSRSPTISSTRNQKSGSYKTMLTRDWSGLPFASIVLLLLA
jgi:hypothetical protein